MGKANWFYSARDNKWVLLGKGGTQVAAFHDSGLVEANTAVLVRGTGTLENLNVGTLATLQRALVQTQATIQNLNVGTLATLRALLVNAQGTVQNLNVGTLATLRAVNVTGEGSIAGLDVGTLNVSGRFRVGGGTRFTGLDRIVGTTEGIAAIGTLQSVWGTFAGSLHTVDNTSMIFASPRSNIAGNLAFGPFRCPTTGLVNVLIGNLNLNSAGSLPAGQVWDVFVLRSGV